MALFYGFFHADFFSWGLDIISLAHPYYKLGVIFEPLQYVDNKGDAYEINKLTIGLVLISLHISFYTHVGNIPSTTTNDTTTNSPIAIV